MTTNFVMHFHTHTQGTTIVCPSVELTTARDTYCIIFDTCNTHITLHIRVRERQLSALGVELTTARTAASATTAALRSVRDELVTTDAALVS
jgi:hypothetical protein